MQEEALGVGSRFSVERRSAPRYPFNAKAEAFEPISGAHLSGQVSQISAHGCYVEASEPFAPKTVIQLTITRDKEEFATWASVANNQMGRGMGIAFFNLEPDQATVVAGWIAELSSAA